MGHQSMCGTRAGDEAVSDDAPRPSLASVRSLSLAHMWCGFALFAVASLLGLYQLVARRDLAHASADLYYRSMTLHGVVQAFVLTTFFIVGFGYAITAASLKRPIGPRAPRLDRLRDDARRLGRRRARDRDRPRDRSLHLLSADGRALELLRRGRAAPRRIARLDRHHDRRDGGVEAGEPRPAGAARAVRDDGVRDALGLDARRRRRRGRLPAPAAVARRDADDRRRARAGALLVDAPPDRVLLADPRVRRAVRDPAEGRGRLSLLRRGRPHRVRDAARDQPAHRAAPRLRRSGAGRGLEADARARDLHGRAADPADRVHDRGIARDGRKAPGRARALRLDRKPPVGRAGRARRHARAGRAPARRLRRHGERVVRHGRDGPQHGVDPGPLSPDPRRHRRDRVLRRGVRGVAEADGAAPALPRPRGGAAVALVRGPPAS